MLFIPLPGQGAKQADIEFLMQWGIGPADFELFASREDWGRASAPHITFPEEGDTPKYWRLAGPNAPEETMFLDFADGKVRTINVTGAPVDPALSDVTFDIYSQEVAIFYRQHNAYIRKLGGIPCLAWRAVPEKELRRLNVKEGVSIAYPLSSSNVERQRAFPTDIVLIMKHPVTGASGVHAAKLNDFANWIAAGNAGVFNAGVAVGPKPQPPTPVAVSGTIGVPQIAGAPANMKPEHTRQMHAFMDYAVKLGVTKAPTLRVPPYTPVTSGSVAYVPDVQMVWVNEEGEEFWISLDVQCNSRSEDMDAVKLMRHFGVPTGLQEGLEWPPPILFDKFLRERG